MTIFSSRLFKTLKFWLPILIGVVFIPAYKLLQADLFINKSKLITDSLTHYGGIYTGEEVNFNQTGENTCGQAVLAYFLTKVGKPETESTIINFLNNDSTLSFADFIQVFQYHGLKTQALEVKPSFFKENPQTSILHITSGHFIVFLREYLDEVLVFDPAYGLVYITWDKLLEIFSGYMLYVYE